LQLGDDFMAKPLMPKATAVWLVDNTALTFQQIADFCGLHSLEVKGIADGEVAQGIQGLDPIAAGQLTREEIDRCAEDAGARLAIIESEIELPEPKQRGGKYTPLSRRQDRPNAIAWLVRNHPELSDAQVSKLIGTTKPTIQSIRDRSHWNMSNIKPVDPVTLGLCRQTELDEAVQKGLAKEQRARDKDEKASRKAREAQLAAAEAAGMPSTQPVETEVTAEAPAAAPEEDRQPDTPLSYADLAKSVFGDSSNQDDKN
jgi:hypothetical protein